MNGHVGSTTNVFQGTHGGNVFGGRNEEGEACQKPDSLDLTQSNTFGIPNDEAIME